jgi:hypothetical protein
MTVRKIPIPVTILLLLFLLMLNILFFPLFSSYLIIFCLFVAFVWFFLVFFWFFCFFFCFFFFFFFGFFVFWCFLVFFDYRKYNINPTGKKSYTMSVIECIHPVPCVGYCFWEPRSKLKEEYKSLDGKKIGELRKSGVEVSETVELPMFVFMGDTAANIFDTNPYPILSHFYLSISVEKIVNLKIIIQKKINFGNALYYISVRCYQKTPHTRVGERGISIDFFFLNQIFFFSIIYISSNTNRQCDATRTPHEVEQRARSCSFLRTFNF